MSDLALDFDHLVEKGWLEVSGFFEKDLARALLDYAIGLSRAREFQKAGIRAAKKINEDVRSDSIFWIDNWAATPALKTYKRIVSEAGIELSRELRAPLKCFEGHLSHYAPGDFYLKHLDQHLSARRRQVTLVTYLNDAQSGELAIFNRHNPKLMEHKVLPQAGKLVLFLSPFIFHEVLPARSHRYGLTGWYRNDEDLYNDFLTF